ncbi:MAG TPA: 2-oxoacid:acceptor oxidoreductase family protein [Candidatus Polarisedimenticolia bacterium]|nr:2-oxoacid:acceptor oxidoreductase family protein [Candidatus Polarisedimenticolia bacterium]
MPTLLHDRPRSFFDVFDRKDGDTSVTHYCPGCGHGNVHKIVAEAIDDLGLSDRVIFINPVGCSVFAYYYLNVGHIQAAHGRAPAVATAVKRARPDSIVICYQGDGDLAAIGGNEILQAASRGESLTVIFINNALYGMTGGQMAPTSLLGQVTTTSPRGRDATQEGMPLRVCELLGALAAPAHLERVALGDPKHDLQARTAVRRAIKNQVEGKGFSLVEILSPCPTGWKMTPPDAAKFTLETMTRTFPLGVVREKRDEPGAPPRPMTGKRVDVASQAIPGILRLVPANGGAPPSAGAAPSGDADSTTPIEERFRSPRIKAAGFGGQGVLFLGSLIAEAGMLAGRGVSWLPSYGPEMRGGTAHCHVILADGPVDSPLVTRATVLFAFNRPSLERFLGEVVQGGLVVYDSSLITPAPQFAGVEAIPIPATTIAERLGSARVANLVALGAWIGRTRILPASAVEAALREHRLKPEAIALNMKALHEGMRDRP